MTEKKIGIIGGSGLYDMEGLTDVQKHTIETPFGAPSDPYVSGVLDPGTRVYFLPRHGVGHRILPGEINYRANIYGFKKLGVEWILSVSAVGSMKEEIHPGDMVVPDQYIDRTRGRASTFFGGGVVAHVAFGDPVCPNLKKAIADCSKASGSKTHVGGTYVCMEGPQFSTRAESLAYRSLGVSVIGMTNIPEAKLAREAEICYGALALATDYDCWHQSEEAVTADAVVQIMNKNVATAKKIVREVVRKLPERTCSCKDTLKHAIVTDPKTIPAETREKLSLIIGNRLG